jgi:hypothetical protein
MITQAKTKQDLITAIMQKADEIHVCDDKLALRMITLPKKCRFIFYAMLANGYKLRKVQALGKFDVTLVKEQPAS